MVLANVRFWKLGPTDQLASRPDFPAIAPRANSKPSSFSSFASVPDCLSSRLAALLVALLALASPAVAQPPPSPPSPYAKWTRGPSVATNFFPIAVWLQDPSNAERYLRAGFNTYVGLWEGPTEDQLARLKKAGMRVICEQNQVALRHLDDPTIIGWMHGDEPDNAQALENGRGYGPPVVPEKIVANYRSLKSADPSRPIMLNLGQGVAWDGWYGRGVRSNHPEDYPKYIEGCDIASFDIYPAVHDSPEVAGKLWYVGHGVERLVQWADGQKIVWNCLECTRISNPDRKPTPRQVRCEAWMSLIHGSQGLIYFVHQFKPVFREPALLDDAEMFEAVTALNRQIAELAPVLNEKSPVSSPRSPVQGSKSGEEGTSSELVKMEDAAVPVAAMVKQHQGSVFLFAVAMRDGTTTATFNLGLAVGGKTVGKVEVLGENRTLEHRNGIFKDRFAPWDVHIYRLVGQ